MAVIDVCLHIRKHTVVNGDGMDTVQNILFGSDGEQDWWWGGVSEK